MVLSRERVVSRNIPFLDVVIAVEAGLPITEGLLWLDFDVGFVMAVQLFVVVVLDSRNGEATLATCFSAAMEAHETTLPLGVRFSRSSIVTTRIPHPLWK